MTFGTNVRHRARQVAMGLCVSILGLGSPALAANDLTEMSLEDLMNVTVTSATKREQSRVDAAAAITVLSAEDIRRSGATNVPEALRHVPGVHVARIDAGRWSISVRGFSGQFSNKLLVLIDGRPVYSYFFGGVYWDVQDLVLADIERIEVIRGPGGTLWGANAVNGVINITTKNANDTQGVHAMGLAGNQEYVGDARFGGKVGDRVAYRAYGRGFKRDDSTFPDSTGLEANDAIWQWRVGARTDTQLTDDDTLTVQGDFYDGERDSVDASLQPNGEDDVRGGNVLSRWTHRIGDRQSVNVQAFYDITIRDAPTLYEKRQTADIQAEHDFALGADDAWLFNWGLEYFWTGDDTEGTATTNLDPASDDFHRFSGFVQAQWNLLDGDLALIAGTKLEYNNFTDFEYQPTGRAIWKFIDGNSVWAAISRAVRTPARIERDLSFALANGNPDFQSENLLAYELGYRNYMLDSLTFDLSMYVNDYEDLTSVDLPLPTTFNNGSEGLAWGGEVELAWQATKDLRFKTSYAYFDIDYDPSPTQAPGLGSSDDSYPQHTWMLSGLWNMPVVPVQLDSTVWYVSELPALTDAATGITIPSYWRLDARLGWRPLDWLELEFVGQNLTEKEHVEIAESTGFFPGTWVPRSYYGRVTITY